MEAYYASVDTFSLGFAPHRLTLMLSPGADFFAAIRRADGLAWPVGTQVTITVDTQTPWDGTVEGDTVRWEVDEVVIAAVIATEPRKARLHYINGSSKVLWAVGPAVVT